MPRPHGKVPGYCRHKHSGQAVVRLDGEDHYLGVYGSDESHELYARLIAEWRVKRQESASVTSCGTSPRLDAKRRADLTVEQMLGLYWNFAKTYYVREGEPTKELTGMKYAMRPVRKLYGRLLAREFGPLALKAVRQAMIDADICRTQVNSRIGRIKRIFKWAVSEELVPAAVFEGLRTVTGLVFGRTAARESEPVRPVPDEWVEATLPFVSFIVQTIIQLQRLTGMRPDEAVRLRMCEIDATGEVWVYEPFSHKNRWRSHRRLIFIGPKAQQLLQAFLPRAPEAYLFSPKESEAARNRERRQNRRSPMTPSQAARRPKRNPKNAKRDHYDVDSYRRAILYGIKKANRNGVAIPHWHPNQLRHSRGTEVRKRFGIEAAQVSLGHAKADVTQIYAERNIQLAIDVTKQCG